MKISELPVVTNLGRSDRFIVDGDTATRTIATEELVYALFNPLPEAHNMVFRGKALGSSISNLHRQGLSSGSFNDLWLGDYWTRNGVDYVVVGFNYWKNVTGVTAPHAVVATRTNITNAAFGSGMSSMASAPIYSSTVPNLENTVKLVFGSNGLLTRPMKFVSGFDGQGYPSATVTRQVTLSLLTPNHIMGARGPVTVLNGITENGMYSDNQAIMPGFAMDPGLRHAPGSTWLHGVTGPNSALCLGDDGVLTASTSAGARGVRIIFGIVGP